MSSIIATASTHFSAAMRQDLARGVQSRLSEASYEATTGRKADVFASLGARAGETLSLRTHLTRVEGFLETNTSLTNKLGMMSSSLGSVRSAAQGVLDASVGMQADGSMGADALRQAARTTFDQIVAIVNTPYNGQQLFAGIESGAPALQSWTQASAGTGLTPEDVMAAIIGGGVATASVAVTQVEEVFSSTHLADPTLNFEATFYNGAGTGGARQSALIEPGTVLDYGVQANDPAFTGLLQGLAMMATADPADFANQAEFGVWIDEATSALMGGIDGVLAAEGRLGGQQRVLDDMVERQQARVDLYKGQIDALEGVDEYEAASRVELLSTQLEATYAITARLSGLSFLNFMR